MATFNKVNDFVENAVHNMDLESDQIVIALSNTAPSSESSNPTSDNNGVLANVTEITYTNLSSRNVTTSSSSQTSGVYKLVLADATLTASGGSQAHSVMFTSMMIQQHRQPTHLSVIMITVPL